MGIDPAVQGPCDVRSRTSGDYIQITDANDRQGRASNAFLTRNLDRGTEHSLDVTTTRTLMGHDHPMPRFHAKYYDQDMLPPVEVVPNTCGHHDACALACSAKYYDDIGYPGHINRPDNFNAALANFNVTGRAGWMESTESRIGMSRDRALCALRPQKRDRPRS